MAATPKQRPENALVVHISKHFQDELQKLFTTSIAPDQQK